MKEISKLFEIPPYSLSEEKKFIFFKEKISKLTYHHYNNSKEYKKLLVNNGFENKYNIREYSLNLRGVDLNKYSSLLDQLYTKGIRFYDAKLEMRDIQDHYKKMEALMWAYCQDLPMPEGTVITRMPFKQFLKFQNLFENKRYGVQIIAVDGDKYIGATDIHVKPKSDPFKAWTGTLGVLREYRRQGIATALKIKAFEKLLQKGIKEIRTDNEANNPMYKINVSLGFTPEPYCFEYQKRI